MNATNLLDISHALEAVNISQQERSILEVETKDKLGQILQKLKTVTDEELSNINVQLGVKGNCSITTGIYKGNKTDSVSIKVPTNTKYVLVNNGNNADSNGFWQYGYSFFFIQETPLGIYSGGSGRYTEFVCYNTIFSNGTLTWSIKGYDFQGNMTMLMNENGKTYYYIAIG